MRRIILIISIIFIFGSIFPKLTYSNGPLDPVRLGTWVITAGVGPGAHYFGNGVGFGPALKGSFEAGMWDLGPGVVTLGGEASFSFFSHNYSEGYSV